jgi:hypothetical protein
MKRMGLTERGKGLKRKQVGLERLSLRMEEARVASAVD